MNRVRIYSQNIGMEFGSEKCAMLVMKSSRRHLVDRMELPNQNKISCRNLIKGINTWVVHFVLYLGPFLKWTREVKQIDQRTRKIMTMHMALHSRDDVDRLYLSRKEGGRGLSSIKGSVDASIQRLEDYIEKCKGGPITAARDDTDNTKTNSMSINRKQKCQEKQLFGRFKRLISNIPQEKLDVGKKRKL